jgi:hypothetical protein
MGSTGTRRFAGSIRFAFGVCALALSSWALTGRAWAAPLPSRVPDGYAAETAGTARWLYPTAAQSHLTRLKGVQRKAWAELSRELGVALPGELDLRLAVNPEQMQALAPEGRTLPGYASGVAYPAEGLILLSLTEPQSWLRTDIDRVLVHELAHVALHRAVEGHAVPRWLSEGFAIHAANERSITRVRVLWEATLRGQLIPLAQLSDRFPARHGEVSIAYAQSADLVGHLLQDDQAREQFRALIAKLRAGEPFDRAFTASYAMAPWQVERQWRALLTHRFGSWPSILSGLTVVWALSALLLVFGYVRVRQRHRNTLKRWAIEEAPVLAMEETAAPNTKAHSPADEVLDAWTDQRHRDSGVPTVMHEGRSYTLH